MVGFIPITHLLPSEAGRYLVYSQRDGDSEPVIITATYTPGLGWSGPMSWTIEGITHWMPLPTIPRIRTLAEVELEHINTVFILCGGDRAATAAALQIGVRTLCGKIRELGYPPRGGIGSNNIGVTP